MSAHNTSLLKEIPFDSLTRDECIAAIRKVMSRPDFSFYSSAKSYKIYNKVSVDIAPSSHSDQNKQYYTVGFNFRPWWYTGFTFSVDRKKSK